MQEEVLFEELLSKLEQLAVYWDKENKGESLSHFDGFSEFYYMSPDHISEAVRLLRILYSNKPHEDLSAKFAELHEAWEELFNVWHEYLMIGDPLESIAYAISRFYHRYKKYTKEHDKEFLESEIKKVDLILKEIEQE